MYRSVTRRFGWPLSVTGLLATVVVGLAGSAAVADPAAESHPEATTVSALATSASDDPPLRTVPVRDPRTSVPENRFVMAGGCYALANHAIFFQATDLGKYLLYTADETFVGPTGVVAEPSQDTVWEVTGSDGNFQFHNAKGYLKPNGAGFTTSNEATTIPLTLTTGCAEYPEVEVNIAGDPYAGATSFQEVRGLIDIHTHGMTHEFLGGRVICSPPWHEFGAPYALVDCPDHQVADGRGAILEDFLAGHTPGTGHDPVGWPTFAYWPNPHSLTHQNVYYKWLERAWRGGLRVFTNLLTENHILCQLYPLKKNSCEDTDSVRLQAADMRAMERYIDAQYGGPGKGWYRIVTDPFEARRVINEGKLAVVMGIETSKTLGCNALLGSPTCSEAQMVAELKAMRDLGVSQMELTNKFDNAFTGVAGDGGSLGYLTNFGNFLSTGSWLRMETCPVDYPDDVHDHEQGLAQPGEIPEQDAIVGAIIKLFGSTIQPAPLYPPGPHCNQAGLTPLGRSVLSNMIDQHILMDPDHMSVYARKAAMTYLEEQQRAGRPVGVVSSHSWSTPDAYPQIYKLGGFVAPYAGDSTSFVEQWKKTVTWADPRYYFGVGYGADMNGFGSQGSPRGAGVGNPVQYPFDGLGGVEVSKQKSGERVYDINADGVSHYGLYPDWFEDAQIVAGARGDEFKQTMKRGPEAYLQTWERAWGIKPDSCRNPGRRLSVSEFESRIQAGQSTRSVLEAVGQPYTRSGNDFEYCVKTSSSSDVRLTVTFTDAGKVQKVTGSPTGPTPPGPGTSQPSSVTCMGVPATQVGTAGRDRLVGTPGPDVIQGFGGDDVITGRGGNDLICGSSGADRLYGKGGRDKLSGGIGRDSCVGGRGRDVLTNC
jgi:hypothetical protein